MIFIEKIYSPKPNLSKIETWSSYDDCRKLTFYLNENNILECKAKIYDKFDYSMFIKDKLKVEATLQFPDIFILQLENPIEYKFKGYLENMYDEYLLKQREDWCNNKRKEFLK